MLDPAGGDEMLRAKWEWPEHYKEWFEFGAVRSEDLEEFSEILEKGQHLGGDLFCLDIPIDRDSHDREFWRLFVRLRKIP